MKTYLQAVTMELNMLAARIDVTDWDAKAVKAELQRITEKFSTGYWIETLTTTGEYSTFERP